MEKTSLKESSEYGEELELQDLFSADKEEMHNKEAAFLVVMKDIADSMQDVRDSIRGLTSRQERQEAKIEELSAKKPANKRIKYLSPDTQADDFSDDSSSDSESNKSTNSQYKGKKTRGLKDFLKGANVDNFLKGKQKTTRLPKTPKVGNRRNSILYANAERADLKLIASNDRMLKVQPSFDHLMLTKMNIPAVIQFLHNVSEYQEKYDTALKIGTLIPSKIIETLMADNDIYDWSYGKFYSLSGVQILDLLQSALKPKSPVAFDTHLKDYIDFKIPQSYVLSVQNFKPMYQALLIYRTDFKRICEFMSIENERNVPKCDNKPGGLIKTFLSKIPFSFGEELFKQLRKSKFSSLEEFLNEFYAEIQKVNEAHLRAKTTSYLMRDSAIFSSPSTGRFPSQQTSRRTHDTRTESRHSLGGRVNMLSSKSIQQHTDDAYQSSSEVEARYPDPWDDNSSLHDDGMHEDSEVLTEEPPAASKKDADVAAVTTGDRYKALNSAHKEVSDTPNGCFHLLFKGGCTRPKCTYSHDPSVMTATHVHYQNLLNTSKFKPRSPGFPSQIQQTQYKPAGGVRAIEGSVGLVLDSSMEDVIRNTFLASFPGGSFVESVVRAGTLHGTLEDLVLGDILFDTGALHASYVDKGYVDANRESLKGKLSPMKAVARLADKKTMVKIEELLTAEITVLDSKGVGHTKTVPLLVLPSSCTQVIIGLPQIIGLFGSLFRDMIDEAISAAEELASIAALDLTSDTRIIQPEQPPWTHPDIEAPEDAEFPLPCSHSFHLHYMEMSTEDALNEYRSSFDEHVNPDFKAATKVIELLETKGRKVFVATDWTGITGVGPIELQWMDSMPTRMKPAARPINPRLFKHTEKEFERLLQYMYEKSDSPIASCLVIAPKSTAPFIRICGDYGPVNKYILIGHFPIPVPRHELGKIVRFKVFIDLDMANSFHQFLLGPITAARLSVVTPWGQVQPKFLPEGVGPASFVLQAAVKEIFRDFEEWSICIFDNFLILAHDYEDAYRKLELFLDRCIQRNMFLKFSKSWLGYDYANFFGYLCKHNTYELSQKRKEGIQEIQFPSSLKLMQSFLGQALFFQYFVPNYSNLTSDLSEMTRKDFNWKDRSTWMKDYEGVFERFKLALMDSVALHYPNYEWPWILRVDASDYACGAALLQQRPSDGALLPINLSSHKFSGSAQRWPVIEKEGYACVFGIKSNDYFLQQKEFVLETDHNNLVWINASLVPKIMRWRIYMQSFNFLIRHIKGTLNALADYLSRMYPLPESPAAVAHVSLSPTNTTEREEAGNHMLTAPYSDILKQVHGGRSGHWGVRRTWLDLNKIFPSHRIPYRLIQVFVSECPVCQKDRLRHVDFLDPVYRHLHQPGPRRLIGIDHLAVTPADEEGNCVVITIVDLFDKFVDISAHKDYSAETAATAVFKHICDYGLIDGIISDPGSAFTSKLVDQLMKWLSVKHVVSVVDVHTSNGVEPANREILRHLKALIYDERILSQWSKPTVLPIVKFLLNSHISSETGYAPFQLRFGDRDMLYLQLPKDNSLPEQAEVFLQKLNTNLEILRAASAQYQDSVLNEKQQSQPSPEQQNMYQAGDYVLLRKSSTLHSDKLLPAYRGPYKVLEQRKNDVICKDLINGAVNPYPVDRLKIFHGSDDDAYKMAMLDADQFVVDRILAYRGDPEQRTSMEFEVRFC